MKGIDEMLLQLLFGNLGTWLWIGYGAVILCIITSLIFGMIARIGGGEDEGE